jgi:hypothetical protein
MLYALLILSILQPSIRSTLPVDTTIEHTPLLSIFQLTIRSALPGVPGGYSDRLFAVLSLTLLQPTFSRALLCLAILQPTLFCTLSADITTDYPSLYSACRYCSWLSTLPTIRSTLSGGTLTDYPIYRLSALLSLALLQPTMMNDFVYPAILQPPLRSADSRRSTLPVGISTAYPLCSLWRYSNRLSNLPTVRSAVSCATLTDYAVCSLLRYSNRLSRVHCSI